MFDFKESVYKIEDFLKQADEIGIIVGESPQANQLHSGLIYKYQGNLRILHLAWHHRLFEEDSVKEFFKHYYWIKPNLPKARQKLISARCRRIFGKYSEGGLKYGLYYRNGTFTDEGLVKLDESASGLTCATFVLAVFASEGYKLIHTEEWPIREEDEEWHKSIIATLIQHGAEPEHITNVISEKGCARFRPEEVSLSCAYKDLPADTSDLIAQAIHLKKLIITRA